MRNSWRLWLALLTMALVVGGFGIGFRIIQGSSHVANPQVQSASPGSAPEASAAAASDDSELRPVTPEERAAAPRLPAVIHAAARPAAAPAASERLPEPSAYTRQLVSGLTNLDLSRGSVTADQAQQWKQNLQALTAQGAAAVPAIREFLAQNQEVMFRGVGGGDLLGQPSLRSAFINALGQISGPEATAALVQTLQTTTLPSEIAQLAETLDQRAPGQYRQETLSAINEVLNMASTGQLPAGWDVGALFKTLQSYGDSTTASALQQLQGPYKYYATMALAGLQGGEGVPALVQVVQDASAQGRRDFAYQMLAQIAGQYPDAGAALLAQAKANQVPDAVWSKIAMGLAGDQYLIGQPPSSDGVNPDNVPGLKTFHIGSGNQNFFSLPVAGDAQIEQRIALIDQLMGATSNPSALSALQAARATLSGSPK